MKRSRNPEHRKINIRVQRDLAIYADVAHAAATAPAGTKRRRKLERQKEAIRRRIADAARPGVTA